MTDDGYRYDDPDLARGAAMFKAMFGEVYGAELCKQLHEGPVGINRFIMTQIGPMVWNRDKLDMKTRMFVALAVLAALGRDDTSFFMRGAFCNGATREEIEEPARRLVSLAPPARPGGSTRPRRRIVT